MRSAFAQGIKGQRAKGLFATPPPGGIPGEDDDIVIEILAELYGLITGPPAWRKSVITTLVELGFKRHPLAPCVAIMYENLGGKEMQFSGLIVLETDDFFGGGIGDQYHHAISELRKRYNFG